MSDRIWLGATYLLVLWLLGQVYVTRDHTALTAYFIALILALVTLTVQAVAMAMKEQPVTSVNAASRAAEKEDPAQK